jgi:hypothetical protein
VPSMQRRTVQVRLAHTCISTRLGTSSCTYRCSSLRTSALIDLIPLLILTSFLLILLEFPLCRFFMHRFSRSALTSDDGLCFPCTCSQQPHARFREAHHKAVSGQHQRVKVRCAVLAGTGSGSNMMRGPSNSWIDLPPVADQRVPVCRSPATYLTISCVCARLH